MGVARSRLRSPHVSRRDVPDSGRTPVGHLAERGRARGLVDRLELLRRLGDAVRQRELQRRRLWAQGAHDERRGAVRRGRARARARRGRAGARRTRTWNCFTIGRLQSLAERSAVLRIWIATALARERPAMSWYIRLTAAVSDSSRYSLYALCVPVRDSYRNQMPKFLTRSGDFSEIYERGQAAAAGGQAGGGGHGCARAPPAARTGGARGARRRCRRARGGREPGLVV